MTPSDVVLPAAQWKLTTEPGLFGQLRVTSNGPKCPRCGSRIPSNTYMGRVLSHIDQEPATYTLGASRVKGVYCLADGSCGWQTWWRPDDPVAAAVVATIPEDLRTAIGVTEQELDRIQAIGNRDIP